VDSTFGVQGGSEAVYGAVEGSPRLVQGEYSHVEKSFEQRGSDGTPPQEQSPRRRLR